MINMKKATWPEKTKHIKCKICKIKFCNIFYIFDEDITFEGLSGKYWDFCSDECGEYFKLLIC